jgi:hypothetical protein
MKPKLFLMMFLILGVGNIFAQKSDCKYAINKIDEFTKEKTVYTKDNLMYKEGTLFSRVEIHDQAINVNGVNKIEISMMCNEPSSFGWFGNFSSILLSLENDNVVTLKTEGDTPYNYSNDAPWQTYWQFFYLSESDWLLVKNNPIKSVRIITNYIHDIKIKKENSRSLSEAINCIDILNIPKAKK